MTPKHDGYLCPVHCIKSFWKEMIWDRRLTMWKIWKSFLW